MSVTVSALPRLVLNSFAVICLYIFRTVISHKPTSGSSAFVAPATSLHVATDSCQYTLYMWAGIATRYGLDKTGTGAHPAFCIMGTGPL